MKHNPCDRYLPGKCRIGTLLQTLAPRFASQCRVACALIQRTADWRTILGVSTWHISFHRPVEIDADAVARFARVLVGQREHKRWRLTYRVARATWSNVHATLRLTEVHHIQWHGKVGMVVRRISTQQFRNLLRWNQNHSVNGELRVSRLYPTERTWTAGLWPVAVRVTFDDLEPTIAK